MLGTLYLCCTSKRPLPLRNSGSFWVWLSELRRSLRFRMWGLRCKEKGSRFILAHVEPTCTKAIAYVHSRGIQKTTRAFSAWKGCLCMNNMWAPKKGSDYVAGFFRKWVHVYLPCIPTTCREVPIGVISGPNF